jgi:phosphoglycolate phosphatase
LAGVNVSLELVVFDWDGTLMDSTGAITHSIQSAARDLGLKVPDRKQASWVIGLGLRDSLKHAVPDLPQESIAAFVERYRYHYINSEPALAAFEGVVPMLERLQRLNVPMAIATGKSRLGLNRVLEQTGWQRFFTHTRTADEGHPKPHPWMLHDLLAATGTEPARAVMVGDTTHDLEMAASAGTRAVAVSYGAHGVEDLANANPEAIFSDTPSLAQWLEAQLVP